ncbi:hypothetical protein FRC07_011565, partial [Ceratobasidium sp. 392]
MTLPELLPTTTVMWTGWLSDTLDVLGTKDPGNIPGTPPSQKFEGPWFTTQLTLSAAIGLGSFILFSLCRTRWPVLFAPRTKLKGFSPHEAHVHNSFFAWIMPTWRTSEFTVLQTVGLDAAVINGKPTGDSDEDSDWLNPTPSLFHLLTSPPSQSPPLSAFSFADFSPSTQPKDRSWLDLVSDASSHLTIHLILTYLFTALTLRFCAWNYSRFLRARLLSSLELVHSIPARTVMCTRLPHHLRGERTLADYFENMGLRVESVSVCRAVDTLDVLLEKRTAALLKLEEAWTAYVGNPSTVESYDPSLNVRGDAVSSRIANEDRSESAGLPRLVVPHRARPVLRPSWFGKTVDALEWLEAKFREADEAVRRKRRLGKFEATDLAFVTFEEMSSAQIATQVEHNFPSTHIITAPAPEPRDIYWPNVPLSPNATLFREFIVLGFMATLLGFWSVPMASLTTLLSYKEMKKVMPWLAELVDKDARIQAIVQNSLPSLSVTALNSLLPFLLEALSYLQGNKARSWAEYALLK